jgi:hypothetical protein
MEKLKMGYGKNKIRKRLDQKGVDPMETEGGEISMAMGIVKNLLT